MGNLLEARVFLAHKSDVYKFSIDHYDNMPMQYSAIIHDCKNENFYRKYYDIFQIFAKNIDRGDTLEPPQ